MKVSNPLFEVRDAPKGTVDAELSSQEAAALLGITERGMRKACDESRRPRAYKDASGAWRIPLSSLPPLAQARYWLKHGEVAPDGWSDDERRQLPDHEAEMLWRRFEDASSKLKAKARRDAEACHLWRHLKADRTTLQGALAQIKAEYAIGKSALYDKLSRIRGYDPMHWPALLLGQWAGDNAKRVEWPADAWAFFLREVSTPARKTKTAWKRTLREAHRCGWGSIPSYDTAKRDWEALDHDVRVYLKEGETALKVKSPTLRRDYDMPLHTVWSLDGRRKDLMVYDRLGKYGREDRVFRLWIVAIEEVRSRMLVGHALGAALNADLVRAAFLDAIKTTGRLIPREIQLDNGMENAAKEITGGAPWRRRGKVKEDEVIGLFPLLEIKVQWATVAHGQTKPVERAFGTLANMVETRPEFRGAYCGNRPEARPEEWDKAKAVPVELVEEILAEEIAAYHRTPHRGQGMAGKAPLQLYTEQINAPGFSARRITEAQARLCAYSAAPVTIRKDGSFHILGARYWSEGTARLAPGRGYYARYNPHNLSDPAYVYRREKLLCEARKTELTAFNDKEAAREIMKSRAAYRKSKKAQARALEELSGAESKAYLSALAGQVLPEVIDPETGEILPAAQVLEMVKTRADTLPDAKAVQTQEDEALRKEVKRLREKEAAESAERLRKRALAGR